MAGPLFHAEWVEKENNQHHQLPVIQISNDFIKALVLFKKGIMEVELKDLRFVRWD